MKWSIVITLPLFIAPTYISPAQFMDDTPDSPEVMAPAPPGGLAQQGIPSFFRLPVARAPNDLRAGQLEVAMLGTYTDMGFSSSDNDSSHVATNGG